MDRFARPRTSDLETRSQVKKENRETSWDKRKAMFLGGLLFAASATPLAVEGLSMPGPAGSGLELRGCNNLTDYRNVPPFLEKKLPERSKEPPFYFNPPPDSQKTSGGETSQPAENLSSSREAQGIRLRKNKVKIAGLSEGKMTPSGETSRSAADTELSQRDALPHPLESTGIAISDSRHQYKNMEHDELSQLRESNVEWRRPTATDVERLQQDKEFQREILSACLDPEYPTKVVALAKNQNAMKSIHSMVQKEHLLFQIDLITSLSDQCQKNPEFRDNFVALANNKKFIRNIRPLFIENHQRILEARQEEARSHNLDAAQESFKRPKGFARKLLSNNDQTDLEKLVRVLDKSDLEKLVRALDKSYGRPSDEHDNNVALVREVKRGNQDSNSVNLKLMAATFVFTAVCFSVGIYLNHQGKKEADEAKAALHKAKIDRLAEKFEALEEKSDRYLEILKKQEQEINKMKKQLLPGAAPVNKESSPPRIRKDRESSPPRKGSSLTEADGWMSTPRRRFHQTYEDFD